MNFELTAEQDLIRKAAREFAERDVVPHVREWDRTEKMDRSVVGRLAEMGFLGAVVPPEYGGMGMDNVSYCLIVEELGRADSSVRGIVSVNVGLCAKTIMEWGTSDQKSEWLPKVASGEALACYGLTEPGHGSDAGNLQATAVRHGGDWVINGQKLFITNGTWAGLALVFARTGGEGPKGITAFLVPTESAGFRSRPVTGKLGLRAQDTGELFLDDVLVPDSNRLGAEGEGFKVAMSALDSGRMSLAAGAVGIAQACLDASLEFASQRHAFGGPIARFQLIQELIADMAVETDAARLLVMRVATLADRGRPHTIESSKAKYFASEAAVRAASSAVQIHGGYGYVDEFPVGKYLRDARVTTLYEGTSQIHKLIIGRALTGESAFF